MFVLASHIDMIRLCVRMYTHVSHTHHSESYRDARGAPRLDDTKGLRDVHEEGPSRIAD